MRLLHTALLAALLPATLLPLAAAAMSDENDLRDFRIDMPVAALPQHGYAGFACADEPAHKLSGWEGWQSCPAGPNGLHAVAFRYEDPSGDGTTGKTQVGGQPVTLSLLIDDQAKVAGIRIATDPHSPLYLHKKAFLFGLQAEAHFGADGWTCKHDQPTETEQPVGGVFIHERCEKTTETRHFVVERGLFRNPAKELRDFVGYSTLLIARAG